MININQSLLKRTNKRAGEENFFIVSIFLKRLHQVLNKSILLQLW